MQRRSWAIKPPRFSRILRCISLLLLGAVLLLGGCVSPTPAVPRPTVAAAEPSGTSGAPAATESAASTDPTPGRPTTGLTEALVTRVIDGDTIEVEMNGATWHLRYIGIDAPETGSGHVPFEWLGAEATLVNEALVGGRTVWLEKDVSETDRYDRLLRYVWVGDVLVNAELVRLGYARSIAYPPDLRYQGLLDQAQTQAREAGLGLWGPQPTSNPAAPPSLTPAAGGAPEEDVGLPDDCEYVGNKNSKKFHRADCSSVAAMSPANRVCFASREEAIAAGYEPCQRCNP